MHLPSTAKYWTTRERPRGLLGAYNSLSKFYRSDKRGSPVSELKQRVIEGDYEEDDYIQRVDALRDEDGVLRRPSVNFVENKPTVQGRFAGILAAAVTHHVYTPNLGHIWEKQLSSLSRSPLTFRSPLYLNLV